MPNGLVCFCGLIVAGALAVAGQQPSTTDQQREAICKAVPCREKSLVKLELKDKKYAEFDFPKGPFVAEGFINILNGERFAVEFDEHDGELTNPHYVREVAHPERTLNLSLSQVESG